MSYRDFQYRWEFDLDSDPQALWPFVADTNRFNRDAGLPALDAGGVTFDDATSNEGDDDKAARRRLRFSKFGVNVTWDEEPFEWEQPRRFGVVRRYLSGPLAEMRVRAELHPREPGGTRLVYEVSARPHNALGLVAIPLQIGRLSARRFARVFNTYDRLARRQSDALALAPHTRLSASQRARLSKLRGALLEQGARPDLAERLAELVGRGDDMTLARLRPYALADHWREPRREVLELFLRATRAGLLDFRWDLLCPLCRGPQHSSASLKDLRTSAHCDACDVDTKANFDRSVELTFRPNASVREVSVREFCTGGPRVTPHVVAQQILRPGESRTLAPALEEGGYRLRALRTPGGVPVRVCREGDAEASLSVAPGAWPADSLRLAPGGRLSVENACARERVLVLERTAWSDQAATAADVTALQTFRDLFAAEALRPGDRISVGSLTVVFTDLRNSTRLYREIGDAVAFGAVMNHFDVLRESIAGEGGSIVKTLGDAVMAVFREPVAALRATLRAQRILASPPAGVRPLMLKAGVHTGACIAVTLNGRLDYFGSNINIAARLEPLSTGEDIVISRSVRDDPQVAALLADASAGLAARPVETALKGFDAERFELWRVSAEKHDEGNDTSSEIVGAGTSPLPVSC
ncbi:MAG TPA: DUF5939 domain-containing protein [Pyrinomonadaceae bacterium]|nr:DUF5939 domain-containing protein [Pyrinomonadaceae bacterium]